MNVCIDIGNTSAKTGIFSGNTLVELHNTPSSALQNIYKILEGKNFASAILSSVVDIPAHIINYIKSKSGKFIYLNSKTALPFKNSYHKPDALGSDRMAQAAGAQGLFPGQNTLAITAGSCLVYDFINKKGQYIGGAISPGMDMRFKALHQFTAKLPYLGPNDENIPVAGNSTEQSILSGVINGMIFEVEKAIENYKSEYVNLQCIISGGDSRYLANRLGTPINLEPDLTLIGLNKILQFNANKKNS